MDRHASQDKSGQYDDQLDVSKLDSEKTFLAIKLQDGVSPCNLISLLLFQFVLNLILQFQITLLSYLVKE